MALVFEDFEFETTRELPAEVIPLDLPPAEPENIDTTSAVAIGSAAIGDRSLVVQNARDRRKARQSIAANSTPVGSNDTVGQYLRDIGQTPLLSGKEEVELAKLIQAGEAANQTLTNSQIENLSLAEKDRLQNQKIEGEAAYERFVKSNLRLVVSISKKFSAATGIPLLDLVQEGNLGMMEAIKKFDHTKGFKFSTYGTFWIRKSILAAIPAMQGTISLSIHANSALRAINKAQTDFMMANQDRVPTDAELAELTNVPEKLIKSLNIYRQGVLSMDAPVNDDGDMLLIDVLSAQLMDDVMDELDEQDRKALLERFMSELDTREQQVIRLRFGLDDGIPKTLDVVRGYFGLSKQRINQIERIALEKMQRSLIAQNF